jgi:hypothetical protein
MGKAEGRQKYALHPSHQSHMIAIMMLLPNCFSSNRIDAGISVLSDDSDFIARLMTGKQSLQ